MSAADADELRRENERLRAEIRTAQAAAREAEHEAGRLRGTIAEMRVQLARARQDQDRFQRGFDLWSGASSGLLGVRRRVGRLIRR